MIGLLVVLTPQWLSGTADSNTNQSGHGHSAKLRQYLDMAGPLMIETVFGHHWDMIETRRALIEDWRKIHIRKCFAAPRSQGNTHYMSDCKYEDLRPPWPCEGAAKIVEKLSWLEQC